MDTLLTFLAANWPLVVSLVTASAVMGWAAFVRVAALTPNQLDDAIVRAVQNNPIIVAGLASKIEQEVSQRLFGPPTVVHVSDKEDRGELQNQIEDAE